MPSKAVLTLVETEPEQSEPESISPVTTAELSRLAEFDEDDEFGDLRAHIRRRVAAGLGIDDIESEALDLFVTDFEVETLGGAVHDIIARETRRHELLEATWSDATDCNRLDEAFRELELSGIIARQSFACCGTCGAGEIWEEMNVARSAGRAIRGYTFFDTRETQHAVDGFGLRLAYGSVKDGEDSALAVAREVIEVLTRHGLPTNWKGSWSDRIGLPIEWKKRRQEFAEEALVQ